MRFPLLGTRTLALSVAALLMTALVGCDDSATDGPTGPEAPNGPTRFSREIPFEEFEDRVERGATRVEIELLSLGPPAVAREIEIEEPESLQDEEEIESTIVAPGFADLQTDPNCSGTLVLELEGVAVEFDGAVTRFEDDDDGDLTCTEFVDRVQAAIDAGREPAVEAKRPAPTDPQDPDDAVFLATRLELEDDDDERTEMEMSIDGDNLLGCETLADPPADCLAVLQVLGTPIVIQQNVTRLREEEPEFEDEDEFEGSVATVDLEDRTFTLTTGDALFRIVDGTEIENDEDEHLQSLEAVQMAIDDGLNVEADGEAVLETSDPRVFIVIEVEFELDDDDDDDHDAAGWRL